MRVVEFLVYRAVRCWPGETPRIVVNINNPRVVDEGGCRQCVISAPFFSRSREVGKCLCRVPTTEEEIAPRLVGTRNSSRLINRAGLRLNAYKVTTRDETMNELGREIYQSWCV